MSGLAWFLAVLLMASVIFGHPVSDGQSLSLNLTIPVICAFYFLYASSTQAS